MNNFGTYFGNYLRTQKLAKQLLVEAEIQAKKGNAGAALIYALKSASLTLTAMNNIAARAFKLTAPRRTKTVKWCRPSKKYPVGVEQ